MFGLGPGEMLMALVAILLLFGAKRIPEIAGSFGKGIREFKKSMSDVQKEIEAPEARPVDRLPAASDRAERVVEEDRPEPKKLI
ncbi:MAG: twin-arginine translocase TatA/TatE family subunit [Gemmatimonadaceae bacterium]|nr:twin-arginine translocase TatA/TatE family subunit [Gemmatimonadaceae bacterium]